ncbi:MAG: hypothetical protein IJT35_08915 [Paludibacteraceae bacterium]|nr:hypothetical protein [Paludibacteraceae bacterium]
MKTYITPSIAIQTLRHSSVLCASGSRMSSNVGLTGGDNSGDVTTAF